MQGDKPKYIEGPDGTIYDSKSSLTWMANDSRLDLDKDITWDEAEAYLKEKNAKKVAGHSDWRMPSVQEASALFDKEKANKDFKGADIHIDPIFPPGTGNCTWTNNTRGEREAQIVFFLNGCPYWYEKDDKTISHAVRLVRR
ncbi:MAG: DUF1566 domain-containing protein [Nitrospinota bacterium]|nr:DUF1566 domain-containing protein [Nitrospinota bacterium]